MERGTFQDSAAKLFNVLLVNIRNCSDFKVYCREVNAYLLSNICKQFANCLQGCITITNLYYIFIFYTISFYSPILLLLFFVLYQSFSFFILQFLTGEESLGGYTVNETLLLLLLLLYEQNTREILSFYFARHSQLSILLTLFAHLTHIRGHQPFQVQIACF